MVGYDRTGTTRVILEAKFWASLREEQVTGYLQQFEHNGPGVLLLVAPERRIQTLWAKIRRVIGTENGGSERVDGGVVLRRAAIEGSEKRLALVSWTLLLERLVAAAQDLQVRSELAQLRGLAVSQDQAAFLPLQGEELAASLPRRIRQYSRIADDAVDAHGVPDGWMATQGLQRASSSTYSGSYFRFTGIHSDLFLGIDYELWGRQGETPIWLGISGGVPINLEALPTELGSMRGWRYVPIRLKTRGGIRRGTGGRYPSDQIHQRLGRRDGRVTPGRGSSRMRRSAPVALFDPGARARSVSSGARRDLDHSSPEFIRRRSCPEPGWSRLARSQAPSLCCRQPSTVTRTAAVWTTADAFDPGGGWYVTAADPG